MAQALFGQLTRGHVDVVSAGVEPWQKCHPMALKLMAEKGIDMTGHYPKHVNDFIEADLDVIVTIGDRAEEELPDFKNGLKRIFWDIADPADADNTDKSEEVFRATYQEIADRLPGLLETVRDVEK